MANDHEDDDIDDAEEDFRPSLDPENVDMRLMRQEVRTNAQRLSVVENDTREVKSVQAKLVTFAKHRQRQWRHYRYYIHVLFSEMCRE
jgi:hypothetical protein